ncbi:hypothetical protein D3C86_1115340 [compost metagenome]
MSEKVSGLNSSSKVELLGVVQARVSQDLNILHGRLECLVNQFVKVGLCVRNSGHESLTMYWSAGGDIQMLPGELEQLT